MLSITSELTKSLLGFYFLHEDESLYVNELVRRLDLDKRNLMKKLKELEKEGIFISQMRGNQKYYSLNKKFALYKEYKTIVLKTIGLEQKLKDALTDIKGIKKAYIFGSYAEDKMDASSDIDIIVIGDQDTILIQKRISQLQKFMDREINVINITEKEFTLKEKKKDPFILNILKKKKIEII
jgi:predicted nucleotidyltransferase